MVPAVRKLGTPGALPFLQDLVDPPRPPRSAGRTYKNVCLAPCQVCPYNGWTCKNKYYSCQSAHEMDGPADLPVLVRIDKPTPGIG